MFKFVLALLFGFLIFELVKKFKINKHSFTEKFAWMYKASIIQTIINYTFLEYIILTSDDFFQGIVDAINSDNPIFLMLWVLTSLVSLRFAYNYFGIQIR